MPNGKDSFTVEANSDLHQELLAARKAGRRYGGKLYSCTLAFELGAKILLDREKPEEEAIKQDLEEYKIQKAAIEQKEKMRYEQLKMMEASRTAKMMEAESQNNNVQKLAQRIIEVWEPVIFYNKRNLIESLADIDRTKLNRMKLDPIFPKRYTEKPSMDDAVKIAYHLLNSEGENIGA